MPAGLHLHQQQLFDSCMATAAAARRGTGRGCCDAACGAAVGCCAAGMAGGKAEAVAVVVAATAAAAAAVHIKQRQQWGVCQRVCSCTSSSCLIAHGRCGSSKEGGGQGVETPHAVLPSVAALPEWLVDKLKQ